MKTRGKARREEQEVRKGQFPHLPREIWEKIYHLLTTKEIAALGPSCMALHGLPLDSIRVTTSSTDDSKSLWAFNWMLKHMRGASQVTYMHLPHIYSPNFMHQPHKALDIIRKQGCGKLPNLQMLKLDIDVKNVEWSHWMSGLLKLAPNLVGLQLKLPVYPLPFDMPVMTNLRHLIISVQCMSRDLPLHLCSLHCLKTLELSRPLSCSSHTHHHGDLPKSLESLCLRNVLPIGLRAPPGCQVSMTGLACCLDNVVEPQDWQTLRPAVTHLVVHMVNDSFDWDDRPCSALPRLEALTLMASDSRAVVGNGVPQPPAAAWQTQDLYVQSLPGEQLMNLTSLTVVAVSICMTLPATPRLKRLCMCARGKLCLHFESSEETGRHLQALDITYRYLLHKEPMNALQRALQKRSIWLTWAYIGQTHMRHIRSTPRPDADTCWYRECSCMCCSQCLAKSGALAMRGAATESAVPSVLLEITAPLAPMERGCKASPWVPSMCQSPPGLLGNAHRYGCIGDGLGHGASEDEDVEYHSDHDSDSFDPWGDYSYPGDTVVQAILNPHVQLPDLEPASDSQSDGDSDDDSVLGPRAPFSESDSGSDTESLSV